MTLLNLLLTIAVAQSLFLLLLALLLFHNRNRVWRRRLSRVRAVEIVEPHLQAWLAGSGDVGALRAALRQLPLRDALIQVLEIGPRLPSQQRDELASVLRTESWINATLAQARSRAWWRRLQAARLLAVVGTARDVARLTVLLRDPRPVVRAAAAMALPRVGGAGAVKIVLDTLPEQSPLVQRWLRPTLAAVWTQTEPVLLQRLAVGGAKAEHLPAWIEVAEAIATPALLARCLDYADHADPAVRIAVARALRKLPHPDAIARLRAMLRDADWRVRARAAQSLGSALADDTVVEDLALALRDSRWWVRFRAALSLAQLGERGREYLRTARAHDDRYVAEMAALVSGLSSGAVADMAEG